jgi:hypothetical protein
VKFIDPEIRHHFSSGLYAKETFIPKDSWLMQHAHKFDHLSVLAQGSVELIIDGVTSVIEAPACLTILAGKHHGIRSLTDVVWYCIHATECTDVAGIDEIIIAPADLAQVRTIAQVLSQGV